MKSYGTVDETAKEGAAGLICDELMVSLREVETGLSSPKIRVNNVQKVAVEDEPAAMSASPCFIIWCAFEVDTNFLKAKAGLAGPFLRELYDGTISLRGNSPAEAKNSVNDWMANRDPELGGFSKFFEGLRLEIDIKVNTLNDVQIFKKKLNKKRHMAVPPTTIMDFKDVGMAMATGKQKRHMVLMPCLSEETIVTLSTVEITPHMKSVVGVGATPEEAYQNVILEVLISIVMTSIE